MLFFFLTVYAIFNETNQCLREIYDKKKGKTITHDGTRRQCQDGLLRFKGHAELWTEVHCVWLPALN